MTAAFRAPCKPEVAAVRDVDMDADRKAVEAAFRDAVRRAEAATGKVRAVSWISGDSSRRTSSSESF